MGLPTSIDTLLEGTIVESTHIEFEEIWDP